MVTKIMQDAINQQIKHEFYSSYLYLAMSAYFESNSLPGFARWMRMQSEEEHGHAMRLFDFITDRDGSVELQALDQPPSEFAAPLDVFQQALEHERKISSLIHQLYALAVKERDYPAQVHLQWFIDEQVEEEKNASQIVEQLKLAGNDGAALLMLDNALGARKEA
jgi:ferritin